MKLEYAVKTDVGKVRDHNEDSYGMFQDRDLFVVCDGMGGHAAGDYASQKVVETIRDLLTLLPGDTDMGKIIALLPPAVSQKALELVSYIMLANRRLFRLAIMYPKLRGMGTTITSVYFEEGYVNVVNVGDSRVYRYRSSSLEQLSVDHSWVEELRQDGEIQDSQVSSFKENNVITRAMGTTGDSKVDWKYTKAIKDDIYLLCSDGLCGEIDDNAIQTIIRDNSNDLEICAQKLVDAANAAGGADNTTVILVKVIESEDRSSDFAVDEIITLNSGKDIDVQLDAIIDKRYPEINEVVPKGVEKEKQSIFKSPYFIAVASVILIFTAIIIMNRPWVEKKGALTEELTRSDVLIRTVPPNATVRLIDKSGTELSKKNSPADFLSIEVGEYTVEISKSGFEPKVITIKTEKAKQTSREIVLNEQAKINLSLAASVGFDPSSPVSIDGKQCKYYGQALTVQRIGMVGKSITVEKGKMHILSIGDKKKEISLTENDSMINIKLENGEIIIER